MSDRVEDDLVAIRGRLDYPNYPWREAFPYLKALEALDRLASDAHRCERLRAALTEACDWLEADLAHAPDTLTAVADRELMASWRAALGEADGE